MSDHKEATPIILQDTWVTRWYGRSMMAMLLAAALVVSLGASGKVERGSAMLAVVTLTVVVTCITSSACLLGGMGRAETHSGLIFFNVCVLALVLGSGIAEGKRVECASVFLAVYAASLIGHRVVKTRWPALLEEGGLLPETSRRTGIRVVKTRRRAFCGGWRSEPVDGTATPKPGSVSDA